MLTQLKAANHAMNIVFNKTSTGSVTIETNMDMDAIVLLHLILTLTVDLNNAKTLTEPFKLLNTRAQIRTKLYHKVGPIKPSHRRRLWPQKA